MKPSTIFQLSLYGTAFVLMTGTQMLIGAESIEIVSPRINANQQFEFSFPARTNTIYTVEFKPDLLRGSWLPVREFTGQNAFQTFEAALVSQGFYRVLASEIGDNPPVASQDVQTAAKAIYDLIDAGLAFTREDIEQIMAVFGVSVIPSSDGALFDQKMGADEPFLLDLQAQSISEKMGRQFMVSASSFVDALAAQGALLNDSPIHLSGLNQELAQLLNLEFFQPDQVLPALVLALGQERAARSPEGSIDPIWGDNLLDPIQFHLLLYSIIFSQKAVVPQSSSTIQKPLLKMAAFSRDWTPHLKNLGRGMITSWIGKKIKFPLGPVSSAQAVVCASVILYSYELKLVASPNQISHRRPEGGSPYESTITATLEFNFPQNPDNLPQQISLFLARCDLPANGRQSGKKITWKLTQELPQHGSFIRQDAATDSVGEATAKYKAIDEIVPKELRVFQHQKTATGTVEARALDLLPQWANLEIVTRGLAADAGGQGVVRLFVEYYEPPPLTLSFSSQIKTVDRDMGTVYTSNLKAELPLTLVELNKAQRQYAYQAEGPITYQSFTVRDPDQCLFVNGFGSSTMQIYLPLAPGGVRLQMHPGGPWEKLFEDCPDDDEPGMQMPQSHFWLFGWQTLHTAEEKPATPPIDLPHWAIAQWNSGQFPIVANRSYQGSVPFPDDPAVQVEEQSKFELKLRTNP